MIDTHVHFWDIHLKIHAWINQYHREDLKQSFNLTDYLQYFPKPEALVTIEAADNNKTLIEVAWLQNNILNNAFGIKIKHMAYIDVLQDSDSFKQQLSQFAAYPLVCGFRHILTDMPLDALQLKNNLITLKQHNYLFGCQMTPSQLITIKDTLLESRVGCIIDHAGLPSFDTQEITQEWLSMLKAYANTQIYFKITQNNSNIISALLDNLSSNQFLVGSNYPVSRYTMSDLPIECITASDANARKLFNF